VALYNIDEAVLELPGGGGGGGWSDSTVNILGTPAPDGSNFGVVVTRQKLQEGQSFAAYVEKHLAEHSQTLRGFELLGQRENVIGGLPAIEAKLTWLNDRTAFFHHIAFMSYYGTVLIVTGSSLAKNAEGCELLMGEILSTIRFRER
jgi:hypothetical protein